MTTPDQISGWFDRGVELGAKYMLLIVDSTDKEECPVYARTTAACWDWYRRPGSTSTVSAVYELQRDVKNVQMAMPGVVRLPLDPPPPETAADLPDGWRLVPIQYTEQQMQAALAHAKLNLPRGKTRDLKALAFDFCTGYRIMVEAAPAPIPIAAAAAQPEGVSP